MVCNSAMSTKSPIAKPITAPGIEPISRPTAATTSGERSAETPKIVTCETAAI